MLSASGISSQVDNLLRLDLRKKNVRLQVVKNSLARRVFDEIGIKVGNVWEGPTLLAWGAAGIADLSRSLDAFIKKNDKIKVKTAVVEGQELSFQKALMMPTKTEALGQIVGMIIGPASQLASQIIGPASQLASQIKTLSEKAPASEPAAAPA